MKKGQCGPGGCGCIPDRVFSPYMISVFFKDNRFKSNSPFLIRQIEYYQQFIDPKLKKKLHVRHICKYSPTCSEYTKRAIKKYGAVKGIVIGSYRLLRCNPFSKGGFDPVKS